MKFDLLSLVYLAHFVRLSSLVNCISYYFNIMVNDNTSETKANMNRTFLISDLFKVKLS